MLERIWLNSALFVQASLDLNDTQPLLGDEEEEWQCFYQGRNGWWRFEERNNAELEENFSLGQQMFETMICGNLYVFVFQAMEQFQKGFPDTVVDLQLALEKLRNISPNKEKVKIDWGVVLKE